MGVCQISPGDSNVQPDNGRFSLCAQNAVTLRQEIHLISINIINTDSVPDPVLSFANMEMSKSGSTARCLAL